jgi:hypothetical protein
LPMLGQEGGKFLHRHRTGFRQQGAAVHRGREVWGQGGALLSQGLKNGETPSFRAVRLSIAGFRAEV